jgi:MFS family permease
VTNLGDGLRLTALPLLATTLTSSPLLISGITAAQFLPWATFAPFGGVIVDRSDRRRLIMATQAWRSAVMAVLAVATLTNAVQIWHLFVVAFIITVGEILVDPSVVATVPTLVTPADLDRANSRISTVEIVTNDFAGGPILLVTDVLNAPEIVFGVVLSAAVSSYR